MKAAAVIFLSLLLSASSVAQTDSCIMLLKNANTLYDEGSYDQAILLLGNALKGCELSKQEKVQANKLMLLSYLSIDNLEEANNIATAIMKIDPYYVPDKFKEDPRLTEVFSRFTPKPTLALIAAGGLNFPDINVVKTYSVVHPDDATGLSTYQAESGFQLKAGVEKRIYKNLWLEGDFDFRTTNYTHDLDSVLGTTIFYSERLDYIDFPLSAKYYFPIKKVLPYLQAGIDFSFLTRSLSTTSRLEESDIVDRTDLRNTFSLGYFGAAGVAYTIRNFRIFGDFRYIYFPDLVNAEGTRYADDVNLYGYYYIDDDFTMSNLQVNIGFSYVLAYKISSVK